MRKISSIFFLSVLAAILSIGASAQIKLSFKATEAGAVTIAQTYGSYGYVHLTTEFTELELPNGDTTLPFSTSSDKAISQIRNAETGDVLFDFSPVKQSYDAPAVAFVSTAGEGSKWEVVVVDYEKPAAPKITIKAPKDSYYVDYNYTELHPESDEMTFENDVDWAYSFTIYAKTGYKMKSITDQNGKSYAVSNPTFTYIYFNEMPAGDVVLTIDMLDLSTVEKESFTVSFSDDSLPYKVYLRDSDYNYFYFDTEDKAGKTFEYIPGDKYTFNVNGYQYGNFYKIECNGEVVASNTTSYSFVPSDGDHYTVYTEVPVIPVPVHFSFADGCNTGVVKSVYGTTSYALSEWSADDFTVNLGTELRITLDTASYDDVAVQVNGEDVELSYGAFNLQVADEAGYEIFVSGKAKAPNKVTVITNDFQALTLTSGYPDYQTFYLTGEVNEFEFSPSISSLTIKAAAGYAVGNVEVTGALSYSSNYLTINGDGTIEIEVINIEESRNKTAVLYIDPETQWGYFNFILGQMDYSRSRTFELNPYSGEPTLQLGYNFIKYADEDCPFSMSTYKSDYSLGYAYLDNELMVNNYGSFPALNSYQEGQVIKVYGAEQDALELSYEFGDNVALQVVHDHVTAVENPSTHNVFKGTQVHLVPVAVLSDEAPEEKLTVLVNNEPVELDDEGRYSFVVNDHTSVVAKMMPTGIEAVNASADSKAVFNLQGIRVADSLENLPAGVYIVAGKKVNVR